MVGGCFIRMFYGCFNRIFYVYWAESVGIGSFISVLFSLDFFFPLEDFSWFWLCVSHSSGTVKMCSLIVSFVIVFSIFIRFFNSLISLFSSSFSSFLFFCCICITELFLCSFYFSGLGEWDVSCVFYFCNSFFHISHSCEYAGCSPVQLMQLNGLLHSNSVWFDFPHFAHIDGLVHLSLGCPYFGHFWHLRGFGMSVSIFVFM